MWKFCIGPSREILCRISYVGPEIEKNTISTTLIFFLRLNEFLKRHHTPAGKEKNIELIVLGKK
jgi:hypothetical protein